MSSYLCRLCLTNCSYEDSSLFSNSIIKIIQYCIPEFDVELVNNPIICVICHNLLKQTESFKRKCLEVQEIIRKQFQPITSTNNLSSETVKSSTTLLTVDTNLTQKEISNSTFNESYRKFLTSATENKLNNVTEDLELSESLGDKHKKKDNQYDEFLNLLDSSPNISMDVKMKKLLIGKEGSSTNFYDDNSQGKSYNFAEKSTKRKLKKVETLETIDNPLDVTFEKFCCTSCDLRLNNLSKLIQHLYTVHQKAGELYTCLLCRYKAQYFKNIKRHYQTVHVNCVDLKGSCVYCAKDMPSFTLLYKHMRKEHAKHCLSDRFRCNSCDFRSRSYETFRKHFFKSHDFICNYCCKLYDSLECLNRHLGHHSKSSQQKKDE